MNKQFIFSCESTVDLPYAEMERRGISLIIYSYTVDNQVYDDDMGRDPEALPRFFRWMREGKRPMTSLIHVEKYMAYFEELLKKGDVLHLAMSSGLSGSAGNALTAARLLREKYPHRKLVVIDSLCGCCGFGLLVEEVADLWEQGASIGEVEQWVLANQLKVQHQFFTSDLTYLRRSGRISGAAATIATVLNICPMMHLDCYGKIIAYRKVRGKKRVMLETVEEIRNHIPAGSAYTGKILIAHSDCEEDAETMRELLAEAFPQGEIRIYSIGTIIAAHCGPGTVAMFFMGDERKAEPSEIQDGQPEKQQKSA